MSTVKIGGQGMDNLVKVAAGAIRGRYDEDGNIVQQFEEAPENGKTNCVTTVTKDNVLLVPEKGCKRFVEIHPGECFDATWMSSTTRGGRRMVNKCNCLTTQTGGLFLRYEGVEPNKHLQKNLTDVEGKAQTFLATSHKGAWANGMTLIVGDSTDRVYGVSISEKGIRPFANDKRKSSLSEYGTIMNTDQKINAITTQHQGWVIPDKENLFRIRRITPTECARLQTIPDWYIWNCSATQQYRMLGNGWCVEVIKHILSFMNIE